MKRTNINLTVPQYLFLKALSEDNDNLPIAEFIRRAIDKYIEAVKNENISASASKRGEYHD